MSVLRISAWVDPDMGVPLQGISAAESESVVYSKKMGYSDVLPAGTNSES
jgi:hypothetical protein